MQMIDARGLDHKAINQKLREAGDVCALQGCCGQRFIAAGMADKAITIEGVPGNALGAYLNGASITGCGNAQDAVGDTMNAGEIVVHGSIGDAAGSFLGEYQAGGVIVVLGLHTDGRPLVGNFPCTGMHGGKLFLRGSCEDIRFPGQVRVAPAGDEERAEVERYTAEFCKRFGLDESRVLDAPFTVVTPDSKNPYKQMYVAN